MSKKNNQNPVSSILVAFDTIQNLRIPLFELLRLEGDIKLIIKAQPDISGKEIASYIQHAFDSFHAKTQSTLKLKDE
jgi:hypothetical protein